MITKEAGRIFLRFWWILFGKAGGPGLERGAKPKLLNSCGAVIHTETWVNLVNLRRDLIYDPSGQTVCGILRGWARWRSFQPRCRKGNHLWKVQDFPRFWSIQIPPCWQWAIDVWFRMEIWGLEDDLIYGIDEATYSINQLETNNYEQTNSLRCTKTSINGSEFRRNQLTGFESSICPGIGNAIPGAGDPVCFVMCKLCQILPLAPLWHLISWCFLKICTWEIQTSNLIPSILITKTMAKWWKTCMHNFQFLGYLATFFHLASLVFLFDRDPCRNNRSYTLQRSSTRIGVAKGFMNFKNRLPRKTTMDLKIFPLKKTNRLPNIHFLGSMLVFGSLSKGRIWIQQSKNSTWWFWVADHALIQIQQHPTTIQVPNLGVKNLKYLEDDQWSDIYIYIYIYT